MRSKNQTIYPESTNELFRPAVTHVVNLYRDGAFSDLEGFIFRAETLYKPQHNTLRYDRVPKGNLMLFDVQSDGEFLSRSPDDLRDFAEWLDIECVPTECYDGADVTEQFLEEYLERASVLGGQTVEGLVIKNYDQLNPYSYHFAPLMGKHVSERFKEVHRSAWARTNPKRNDVLLRLGEELRTEARWEKAIQHMAERGDLEGSPRDIGKLINEVHKDVLEEEAEYLKEELWNWAKKQLLGAAVRGLPEWYKARLLERALPGDE
ncbi:MAG: RNA ligase family protein [Nitrososphaerota archaeon]